MIPFIDYSQWKSFHHCQAEWYEKTINRRSRRWGTTLRDDALCLGSLVHSGLQQWEETNTIVIPEGVIAEVTPTPETLQLAQWMVYSYSRKFPTDPFEMVRCEAPLRFPLFGEIDGLAKIDKYFYLPEETTISNGIEDQTITLSPGWWVNEYKTKGLQIPMELFLKKWEVNMQVVFQMLALRNYINSNGSLDNSTPVQGVLVTALEKPSIYIPKRKCKTCQQSYEFSSWIPSGDLWSCPICGGVQKLKPLGDRKEFEPINCFRFIALRTAEQLTFGLQQIEKVASQMALAYTEGIGPLDFSWNREKCVDDFTRRVCPYYRNHTYNQSTLTDIDMEETKDYVKEKNSDGEQEGTREETPQTELDKGYWEGR